MPAPTPSTTRPLRAAEDNGDLKHEILAAAIEIATEQGWAAVSVRRIAQRIGYSTFVIYTTFGGKTELFAALRQHGFDQLMAHYSPLEPRKLTKATSREAVRRIARGTLDFYLENRALYQAMFGVVGLSGVFDECDRDSLALGAAQYVQKFLTKALDGDPTSLFMNWWALVHGFISIGNTLSPEEFEKIVPYLDQAIERFLRS